MNWFEEIKVLHTMNDVVIVIWYQQIGSHPTNSQYNKRSIKNVEYAHDVHIELT